MHTNEELFEEYDMKPFISKVQTIDRTFVDKLFAICDYYEKGQTQRFSRHLYNVHKIWKSSFVDLEGLKLVLPEIIEIRQKGRESDTISCRPGYELRKKTNEIIETEFFKQDYRKNTSKFLFEEVEYSEIIKTIRGILESGLLPDVIEEQHEGA